MYSEVFYIYKTGNYQLRVKKKKQQLREKTHKNQLKNTFFFNFNPERRAQNETCKKETVGGKSLGKRCCKNILFI